MVKAQKAVVVLFAVVISHFCFGQTVNSSCTGPDSLLQKYRMTADKMAIMRCIEIADTYKDSVTINPSIRSQFMKALLAVYNATMLPARDTIVFFNVTLDYRYAPYQAVNMLRIDADSTKPWISNLRKNIIPCGYAGIDNLFTKYYLKVTGSSMIWPPQSGTSLNSRIFIATDTNCFIGKLCEKFNGLPLQGAGIGGASPQSPFSDATNVTYSMNLNYTELTYSIGWGDCWSGCIYSRYWTFRVYSDCSVEYRGSYGDAVPPHFFTGIRHEVRIEPDFALYPNPASTVLHVQMKNGLTDLRDITIRNVSGQVVYYDQANITQINIEDLPPGIYFLELRTSRSKGMTKFVKD